MEAGVRHSSAARWGVLIGCCGWMLGLGAVAASAGAWDWFPQIVLPGLAASLGLGCGVLLHVEFAATRAPADSGLQRAVLLADLVFVIGLLLLLNNHWIAPRIEQDAEMLQALESLSGVRRTAEWLPHLLLYSGAVAIGSATRRLLRAAA
ncbi:MAG TPA: hypothetical protein VGC54_11640 [Planctomycetota bacterium]